MCTPYCYFLEWESGMKYYGVRYSTYCHPNDLWNPYKTSSNYVKDYIKHMGNPIKIEIRKIFEGDDKVNKAIVWEQKVLKRLNAAYRHDYLNKRDIKGINYNDFEVADKRNKNMINAISQPKVKEKIKATNLDPKTKERRSIAALKREADPVKKENRIRKAFSEEAIAKRKKAFDITVNTPEFKEKRQKLSREINKRPEVIKANKEKNSGLNNARAIQDIFMFKHKNTGEIKILTCYEMTQYLRSQGIKYAHASSLVRNKIKTLGGWAIISSNHNGI